MASSKALIGKIIMIIFLAGLLSTAFCAEAGAAKLSLKEYTETYVLDNDGNGSVTLRLLCGETCPDALKLPFAYDRAVEVTASQGDPADEGFKLSAQIVDENGSAFLLLKNMKPNRGDLPVIVSFTAFKYFDWKKSRKKGSGLYLWKHEFLNLTRANIEKYAVDLVLPAGYTFQSVERSRPALTSKDPKAPYSFLIADKKHHVTLNAEKGLKLGKEASIEVTFQSENKSPFFLIVFGLLGLGYLIFYRDLLARAKELRAAEKKG